jgi:NADH dehydrogenase [ubiquinone] 1 alpha subcomplex assembly factor 6
VCCAAARPRCPPHASAGLSAPHAGIADRDADHCASHVGKAVGIAAVLRGTPFHASRRRSYLPLETCAKHRVSQVRCPVHQNQLHPHHLGSPGAGFHVPCTHSLFGSFYTQHQHNCAVTSPVHTQEELYRGQASEALRDVALEVAGVARAHLQEARSMCSKLPKDASQVLLSATGAGLYLQALERCNFDLFDPALVQSGGASPLWYALTLKLNMLRGNFYMHFSC